MLSIKNLQSAAQAAHYFKEKDDYYSAATPTPGTWSGRGAEELGLRGEVTKEDFEKLLSGRAPDETPLSGTGGTGHRPGLDLTSAPQSRCQYSHLFQTISAF